ncbi:uncharacterized protein LOC116941563 isoform X2 [Petromyzon marinus]|uniref:uncharacterized protein LOC116941563 isoform X2 n=1 Tax=Petromyzon marinus TaxID=7757 RepID=UPI003F702553
MMLLLPFTREMLPLRRALVATAAVALCMLLATVTRNLRNHDFVLNSKRGILVTNVSMPLQTTVLDLMPILNRMLTWPNNASQAELSSLAVSANFSSPLYSMAMYVYNVTDRRMLLQQERHPRRQCICIDFANPDQTNVYDVIVLGKNEPIIPQLIFPRKPLTDASLPPSPPLFGVMMSKNATLAQGGDDGGGADGATRLTVEEVTLGPTFLPSLPKSTVLPAARTGDAIPPPPPSSAAHPVTTDRSDERGSSSATSRATVTGAVATRGRDLHSSTSNRTAERQPTPPAMFVVCRPVWPWRRVSPGWTPGEGGQGCVLRTPCGWDTRGRCSPCATGRIPRDDGLAPAPATCCWSQGCSLSGRSQGRVRCLVGARFVRYRCDKRRQLCWREKTLTSPGTQRPSPPAQQELPAFGKHQPPPSPHPAHTAAA